ncbi:MAG: MFS transporter [Christensenellaceae bacterium]|jgi:UMF1 family MFS transporter|nr:MFS transporter [Christensenellaceae bacterium]
MVDFSPEEVQNEALDDIYKPSKPLATKGIMGFYNKHFNKDGFQLTKAERNWALYDCGNSAIYMFFVLVGVSISELTYGVPWFGDNLTGTMSIFNSVSGLIIAILGPVLGAIADNRGRKRSLFKFFVIMGLMGCYGSLLANLSSLFSNPTGFFVIFLIFAMMILIGIGGSLLFYDSMLGDVTTPARGDRVSASGYAIGYVGSLAPFLVCLAIYYFFMTPADSIARFNVSLETAYALTRLAITVCIVISGTWWLIWTRPLLKTYKQVTGVDPVEHQIKDAFIKLGKTFKELKKYKAAFIFLFAFFFYVNGVNTVIALSATYAKEVLNEVDPARNQSTLNVFLIVALIMTQIIAAIMSIFFGKFANKTGARPLIIVCVIGYFIFVSYGVFMKNIFDFFVLAAGVGIFLGGIQALSRSYYTKLAPDEKKTEFFGLYDIFNKSSNFLGSFLYAAIILAVPDNVKIWVSDTHYITEVQIAVGCLAIFFLIGLVLLLCIPRNAADKDKKSKNGAIPTDKTQDASSV